MFMVLEIGNSDGEIVAYKEVDHGPGKLAEALRWITETRRLLKAQHPGVEFQGRPLSVARMWAAVNAHHVLAWHTFRQTCIPFRSSVLGY